MFAIEIKENFRAAHHLELPGGKTEDHHLHDWQVIAEVQAEKLDKIGTVMDFHKLQKFLNEILQPVNGKDLNRIDYFADLNPSAENVAKYIYEKLEPKLPYRVKLICVRVMEEPDCWAKFS